MNIGEYKLLAVIRCIVTIACVVHPVSKESQHFWSCLSFREECIPMNIGLYIISTCRFLMTPDYMTLTLGPRKNPWRKVAFLLRLSVNAPAWGDCYSLGKYISSNVCLDILSYICISQFQRKIWVQDTKNFNFDFLHSLTSGWPPLVLRDIKLKICIFDVPNYILEECLNFRHRILVCFVRFVL